MRILGFDITRTAQKALNAVDQNRGGWFRILESYASAWQNNVEVDYNTVLSNHADFACKTLIASDIAKLRVKLVQRDSNGIWSEVDNRNYQVLARPNHYQTRIQFFEAWATSKLQRGNAIVLKQRNAVGGVVGMYVLDWQYVTPLVADNGDVFYRLKTDKLSNLPGDVVVPAREVIHDRFNCLFHPLVGLSPIFAGGLAAVQGLRIQEQSTKFFENGARPGGILTAPGHIEQETADRLKEAWTTNFSGENAGKIAVLGDGLKYEAMTAKAVDSQLIEQLKWSAEVVCSTYHVPPYKIGIGTMPSYNNIQALNTEYYSQCLQVLIESIELLLDEALGLRGEVGSGANLGVEFDIDGLLRMDSLALMEMLDKGKNYLTPDEGRRRLNLKPTPGGNVVLRQQQDFSLEALAKRDAQDDPFGKEQAGVSISVGDAGEAAATDVQATALNGAQVTSLMALLAAVADGSLPPETARAAIAAAFPLMSEEEISDMIDPLIDFEPEGEGGVDPAAKMIEAIGKAIEPMIERMAAVESAQQQVIEAIPAEVQKQLPAPDDDDPTDELAASIAKEWEATSEAA